MSLREQLFGFRGRLRRLDWWVLGILVGIVDSGVGLGLRLAFVATEPTDGSVVAVLANVALAAPFLWVYLALNAKRMHDLNWPAWPIVAVTVGLQALAWTPPGALGWIDYLLPIGGLSITLFDVINWTLVIGVLVVLGFIDGTRGPNRYGPSPKLTARPDFLKPEGVG